MNKISPNLDIDYFSRMYIAVIAFRVQDKAYLLPYNINTEVKIPLKVAETLSTEHL